jgi:hypothetical protein
MATWTVTSAPGPLNFEFGGSQPRGGKPRIWFRLANAPQRCEPRANGNVTGKHQG